MIEEEIITRKVSLASEALRAQYIESYERKGYTITETGQDGPNKFFFRATLVYNLEDLSTLKAVYI